MPYHQSPTGNTGPASTSSSQPSNTSHNTGGPGTPPPPSAAPDPNAAAHGENDADDELQHTINAYGPKVANGTATPSERARHDSAVEIKKRRAAGGHGGNDSLDELNFTISSYGPKEADGTITPAEQVRLNSARELKNGRSPEPAAPSPPEPEKPTSTVNPAWPAEKRRDEAKYTVDVLWAKQQAGTITPAEQERLALAQKDLVQANADTDELADQLKQDKMELEAKGAWETARDRTTEVDTIVAEQIDINDLDTVTADFIDNIEGSPEMKQKLMEHLSKLKDMTEGKGPSLAQDQLKQGTERAMAQQMALLASQRGYDPSAVRGAQGNLATMQQDAALEAAMLRSQEQKEAMGMYGTLAGSIREQDIHVEDANARIDAENMSADLKAKMFNSKQLTDVLIYNAQAGDAAAIQNVANVLAAQGLDDANAAAMLSLWTGVGIEAAKDTVAENRIESEAKIAEVKADLVNKEIDLNAILRREGMTNQLMLQELANQGNYDLKKLQIAADALMQERGFSWEEDKQDSAFFQKVLVGAAVGGMVLATGGAGAVAVPAAVGVMNSM